MSDTLMRQWQMLRMIPRHPRRMTTDEIERRLLAEGFRIHRRSIQRDLMRLSALFPLECHEAARPYGWCWARDASAFDIPGMDAHAALAFWLVREHLEPLLPEATLRELAPHFIRAGEVLDTAHGGAACWRRKVRVLQRGPALERPAVDAAVQRVVHEGLLRERRIRLRYRPRGKDECEYEASPLGMLVREGVIYLVATLWDYADPLLLALHRMREAALLDAPATPPEGFDLDAWIATGEPDYALGDAFRLEALFTEEAAFHLRERPLAPDQALERHPDGRVRLTATVQDTQQLRWWLLGFGDQVEVLAPAPLRAHLAGIARRMARAYDARPSPPASAPHG